MKAKSIINLLIVSVTVAVVITPILWSQLSEEIARWHLAAAANAEELGIGDRDESLNQAKQYSKDIFGLRDYWLLLLQRTLDDHPSRIPELVRFAKTRDENLARLGTLAVRALEAEGRFELAVRVLEESLSEQARESKVNLNYLAYMRSLAGVELDVALKDINKALETSPEDPALRDTRAWVLYQQGKYEKALEDADFAVKEMVRLRESDPLRFLSDWGGEQIRIRPPSTKDSASATDTSNTEAAVPDETFEADAPPETESEPPSKDSSDAATSDADPDSGAPPSESADDQASTTPPSTAQADQQPTSPQSSRQSGPTGEAASAAKSRTGEVDQGATVSLQTFQEGVLRYHRGRILEKLGRFEEMEQEWEWLRAHNLPIDDSLH